MAFTSAFLPTDYIIDDAWVAPSKTFVGGEEKGRGLMPRNFERTPYGATGLASPFPRELLVPEVEWKERIEEMERKQIRLSDLIAQAGLEVLDQGSTNYCWINAPTFNVMVARVLANQPLVRLSPASVGAKIKNFTNVGGWGTEGLDYIIRHGLVPQELWPANAIQRQYDTPQADAERSKYRVSEWWELKPRNWHEHGSALLNYVPVCVGLNYWGHEVTDVDLVIYPDGSIGPRFANSWGRGWGTNGYGLRKGSKIYADDAVCARVATPSIPILSGQPKIAA